MVLRRYPLLRGVAAYSLLYPSANVVQQSQLRKKDRLDVAESVRFLLYGGFVHAPIVHGWMKLANWIVPGTSLKAIFKKVLIDQVLFAPFALSAFYVGLSTLERKTRDDIYLEWREKFPKTWMSSACVWPFLQGLNFRFVPLKNRTTFIAVMSFFWTTALSYWKSEDIHS